MTDATEGEVMLGRELADPKYKMREAIDRMRAMRDGRDSDFGALVREQMEAHIASWRQMDDPAKVIDVVLT